MNASLRRAVAPTLAFALVGALALLSGCETLDQRRRQKDDDAKHAPKMTEENESTKIPDVDSDPAKPKSFFRPSRLGAGLSDESREIESHFGIQ